MSDDNMIDCEHCNTRNTVFVGTAISRCIRCLVDSVVKKEDGWNED